MNFIIPIILILSSIGIFFGYIDPNYRGSSSVNSSDYSTYGITALQSELSKYQDVENSAVSLVAKKNDLVSKETTTISDADQQRLEKMLPSNINNLLLIIEISQIAQKRNLLATNIVIGSAKNNSSMPGQQSSQYETLPLSFTISKASYSDFLGFLQDLENNLRLVDITNIGFSSNDTGFYDYNVSLNTYWLQ